MRVARPIPLAVTVLAALTASPAFASAAAYTSPVRTAAVRVSPAGPTTSKPITVTWRADRSARKGERFGAEVLLTPDPRYDGYDCATHSAAKARPLRRGQTLRQTFYPDAGTLSTGQTTYSVWCPGSLSITLWKFTGAPFHTEIFLAKRVVQVRLGPGEYLPATPQSLRFTVLPGSTLTATAPGRPDRVIPLSGDARGLTDRRVDPMRRIMSSGFAGSLSAGATDADPLCPGSTPTPVFGIAPATTLTLDPDGATSLSLTLLGRPFQLFGCGGAGPFGDTTTIALTGRAGPPSGFGRIALSGAITGIPLPAGSQGGLAANLLLNVDPSGRL